MTLKVAKRALIPPFIVMDVMRAANERAAQGEDVLHLEVGQPGTSAPAGVIAAVKTALETDLIGYTEALGTPALRRRIAAYYAATQHVEAPESRIAVTTGSSGGFILSFLAAFEPGDRVALAAPGYPAYRNILRALGIEPVSLPSTLADRYQPTIDLLEAVEEPLDGLIVASPSNPTGTMLGVPEMQTLCAYCHDRGIRLISDEIYHGIAYGTDGVSALRFTQEALVINSFSKYFSMTGWRIGWMVVPEDLVRPIECLAQNLFISAPTLSQHAAAAAFDCTEELEGNVRRYAENRALLLDGLPQAGFDKLAPADGAFYIYADVAHLTNDSEDFCREILSDTGVAMTPGTDFDPDRGRSTLRISFAGSTEDIGEAITRLKRRAEGVKRGGGAGR